MALPIARPPRNPMTDTDTDRLRRQLIGLLDGVGARMPFDEAVADFPDEAINAFPPNVEYTPWHLLEHIRLTQGDILDYIVDRDYVETAWPTDYWPALDAIATPARVRRDDRGIPRGHGHAPAIVADPATDLFAAIPNTPGHTVLREVRIVGDHNAYHVGEFAILRQVMGTWPPDRDG